MSADKEGIDEATRQLIAESFRPYDDGFIAFNQGIAVSCPPHVIASVALRHGITSESETDVSLRLPEGYDSNAFHAIRNSTGELGLTFPVSVDQARDYAQFGSFIMVRARNHSFEPPISRIQAASIFHLIQTVRQTVDR